VAVGGALDASLDFIVGSRTPTSKGCIQLWEVPVECLDVAKEPLTQPRLDVVLCHDFGTVFDLRWCPVGCYQKVGESDFPRLGVFAATFHDGSLRVFSVPHATALRSVFGCQDDLKNPLFVRLRPVFSSVLKEGTYTRVSWKVEGDRVLLATGTATGEAVVFDLSQLPDSTGLENIYPPIFFRKEHQFFLRSIAWAERSEQGGRFVTSGYDGKLMISNLDDYQESDVLRRHNGFLTDVLWRADLEGIFFACSDNTVRYIPDYDRTKNPISIVHRSGIWSLDASKHHTFIASASADGSVQIANVMRQRARDIKNIQVPVYRVLYNYEDPSALTFCENEPAQEAMFQKADMRFWPLECIIYAARFHPEAYASTWIVSGGRTGVVRIESTYRDKAEQIGR
jgi:WD40 repeat protein